MKSETKIFLETYLLEKMKTLEEFVKNQNIFRVTIPDKDYCYPIELDRLNTTNLNMFWSDRTTNDEPFNIWISNCEDVSIKFDLPEVLSEHHKIYYVFGFIFKKLSNNFFNKEHKSYSQIINETFKNVEKLYK